MNRLAKRIQRLEGGTRDKVTVVARVPLGWPRERQEAEVSALAIDRGAVEPFALAIIEQNTPQIDRAYLEFVGDMRDLFDDIAKNGTRIGQPRTSAMRR